MTFMHSSNHSFFFNVESDKFEIIWTDFFMLYLARQHRKHLELRVDEYNIVQYKGWACILVQKSNNQLYDERRSKKV